MINKISVATSNSEKEFIKEWIARLTNCDERLVCDTKTLDEQFSDKANCPKFTVRLANSIKIIFTRSEVLENPTDSYNVEIKSGNDVGIAGEIKLVFGQKSNANAKSIREWTMFVVGGEKAIAVSLKDNSGIYKVKSLAVNDSITSLGTATVSSSSVIPSFEENDPLLFYPVGGGTVKAKHRMDYIPNETGMVEILKNKTFVQNNDTKPAQQKLTTTALYDCSLMGSGLNFVIDGEEYYAVSAHTLILLRKEV